MAWSLPERAVLGIFGDQPVPDLLPRGLVAHLDAKLAQCAHEAILFDVLDLWGSERILAPGGRRVFVYAPAEAGPWFDARVAESFSLQPQSEGPPGPRLHAFLSGEIEDGAERVVAFSIGTPTLDPSVVVSAFLCLESRDLVLGPNASGGCYLVGCGTAALPVLNGWDWASPHALSDAVHRLRDTGLSLAVLPPWYDVCAPLGWQTLVGHLQALQRAGVDAGLPRVAALLEHTGDPAA